MFSLTYSAAYDPYHTTFRLLALMKPSVDCEIVDFEIVRIVDFYHNFPWLLRDFSAYSKIPKFQKDKNKIIKLYPKSKFEILPDKYQVFQRMRPSQLSAWAALSQFGIVEVHDNVNHVREGDFCSTALQVKIEAYRREHKELLPFLWNKLAKVPLLGPGGLKDRSGLGEFRYDVV